MLEECSAVRGARRRADEANECQRIRMGGLGLLERLRNQRRLAGAGLADDGQRTLLLCVQVLRDRRKRVRPPKKLLQRSSPKLSWAAISASTASTDSSFSSWSRIMVARFRHTSVHSAWDRSASSSSFRQSSSECGSAPTCSRVVPEPFHVAV